MSKVVNLIILGEPMGKQRPRFSTYGGFVRTHTPEKTERYEDRVRFSYRQEYSHMVFEHNEQIKVKIVAYFSIPKTRYRYHKKTNTTDLDKTGLQMKIGVIRPIKKPDTDNVAKICLDSLNGIAYPDDSQIVSLSVEKFYTDEQPRVEIILESEEYETSLS